MDNFLGVPYPLMRNPKGYFHSQGGVRQVKADLLILLLTNPGERVFLPAYGTPLRDLVFEPNNLTLQARARQMIINSIATWEPRISIEQIEVSSVANAKSLNGADDFSEVENVLSIKIKFLDPEDIQTIQELKLEVPLGNS